MYLSSERGAWWLLIMLIIWMAICHIFHTYFSQKNQRYFLPSTQGIQKEIRNDETDVKTILEDLRTTMKEEAVAFKSLVDEVVSKNLEQIDKVEESLMELQQNQDKTYSGYSYLKAIGMDFLGCLSTGPLDLREG